MEKTIEERAKSHAGVSTNPRAIYNEDYVLATRYASYKEGATEQKDIDENHFREVKKMLDKVAFEEREKAFKAGYHTAIEEALKAFCKTHGCGIPHSTCTSLGTCDEYDTFNRELTKAMEG